MATISAVTPAVLTGITYSQDASSYSSATDIATVGYAILNDGSATSGGCANGSGDPGYLQADCGYARFISTATFGYDKNNVIPGGFGPSYLAGAEVQGSLNNSTWTTIATIPTYNATNTPTGLYTVTVNQIYRYIRLYRSGGYIATTEFSLTGGSIDLTPTVSLTAEARSNPARSTSSIQFSSSFTADGSSTRPPRIVTTFTQSGIYSGNVAATYAAMNNSSATTGYTATSDTGWVQADCGTAYTVKDVLFGYDSGNLVPGGWGTSYGEGISIQASSDATNWTTITTTPTYSSTGSTNGLVRIDINTKCRYLRLYKTSYFPVTEFALFGTPAGSTSFFTMF